MINYVRVIKAVKNIEEFSKKKKNRIIRNAIWTEIVNVWKPILKFPFVVLGIIFAIIFAIFDKIADLFDLIATIFDCLSQRIEDMPIIKFGNQEEIKETIKIIREKQIKKCQIK